MGGEINVTTLLKSLFSKDGKYKWSFTGRDNNYFYEDKRDLSGAAPSTNE